MSRHGFPTLARAYLQSYRLTRSLLEKAHRLAWTCFTGLWLGVLTRDELHSIDEEFYTSTQSLAPGEADYHSEEHNRRGLWEWETELITRYFANRKHLILIGAGGGREVLALQVKGFEIDGFESHPGLAAAANRLLESEGHGRRVQPAPRDRAPKTSATYDGVVVGWGMYALVQGRKHRVALLRQLRAKTRAGNPILLSFFAREGTPRMYLLSTFLADAIRRALRREPTEVGDWLAPNYVHWFSRDEIARELSEGGFELVHFGTIGYGHAVGIAIDET